MQGSVGYKVMPPKKSKQGKFYPLVNYRSYAVSTYTNQDQMLSADIRSRIFVSITMNTNDRTNGFSNKEIVYSINGEQAIKQSANEFVKVYTEANNQGVSMWDPNSKYANWTWQSAPFVGGTENCLYLKPTTFTLQNSENPVQGFLVGVTAQPQYCENITANQAITLINFLLNTNLTETHKQMILMYQNATIEAKLDSLLTANGINGAVDYQHNTNSLLGNGGFGPAPQTSGFADPGRQNFAQPKQPTFQPQANSGFSTTPFTGGGLKQPNVNNNPVKSTPAAGESKGSFAAYAQNNQTSNAGIKQPMAKPSVGQSESGLGQAPTAGIQQPNTGATATTANSPFGQSPAGGLKQPNVNAKTNVNVTSLDDLNKKMNGDSAPDNAGVVQSSTGHSLKDSFLPHRKQIVRRCFGGHL